MRQRFYIFIIGFFCIVIVILVYKPKIHRFFEIDSCLDKGGSWDYEKNICKTTPQNSFLLKGTWIYHDSSCFEIIEILDTNDVIFTSYIDRNKCIGELDKNFIHYFYKSKGSLGFFDANTIWIATDKYRFDYYIKGDTIEEFDKMGLQKKLIRMHETNN
jgi:hypothetical protein